SAEDLARRVVVPGHLVAHPALHQLAGGDAFGDELEADGLPALACRRLVIEGDHVRWAHARHRSVPAMGPRSPLAVPALTILALPAAARGAEGPTPPNLKALQAEVSQMLSSSTVAPGRAADAAAVEEVPPPADGWVAARIRAPYRDFPNVVLFHWDG